MINNDLKMLPKRHSYCKGSVKKIYMKALLSKEDRIFVAGHKKDGRKCNIKVSKKWIFL